jgi:hypothetical protein
MVDWENEENGEELVSSSTLSVFETRSKSRTEQVINTPHRAPVKNAVVRRSKIFVRANSSRVFGCSREKRRRPHRAHLTSNPKGSAIHKVGPESADIRGRSPILI